MVLQESFLAGSLPCHGDLRSAVPAQPPLQAPHNAAPAPASGACSGHKGLPAAARPSRCGDQAAREGVGKHRPVDRQVWSLLPAGTHWDGASIQQHMLGSNSISASQAWLLWPGMRGPIKVIFRVTFASCCCLAPCQHYKQGRSVHNCLLNIRAKHAQAALLSAQVHEAALKKQENIDGSLNKLLRSRDLRLLSEMMFCCSCA